MPNITPHLWYDKNTALQAAKFYVSVFGGDSAGGGLLSILKPSILFCLVPENVQT